MSEASPLPPPTPTALSMPHLLGLGLGGLACLGGAAALVLSEHPAWGGLLGLFGLCLLIVAPSFREGPCPRCGHLQAALGASLCPGCADWSRLVGGRFVAVAPGEVSRATEFTIPLRAFIPPTEVDWPWPGRCCVCGRQATRTQSVSVTAGQDAGLTQRAHTWAVQVPHCEEHEDGVQWLLSPAQVSFRSYDYARAFQAANRGRV